MNATWKDTARACLNGAETGAMNFPQIVATLIEAGFDGYAVDLRAATATCYRPDGDHVALAAEKPIGAVVERFDAEAVRGAIREAQQEAPGYSYPGFCAKVAAAGCAGYLVSFPGRLVLYFGRDGQAHQEYFPGAQPPTSP